ncbi:MAG: alpha-mannosidase [Clostridia bacterium]|nr:alpha-mannosidase [Clostridia bacterium]
MNNNSYISRTTDKFESVLNLYARRIFKTIAKAEDVYAFETMEHLRLPPELSDMKPITDGANWGGEYANIWLRTSYTVPAEADGKILGAIPDCDAVEVLCFKNGKPSGIINSKNRFIGGEHSAMFISTDAKAGETVDLAFECYAGHTCFGTQPYDNYTLDESKPWDYNHTYRGIRIVVMDTVMRDFVFDLATVLQLAKLPGENFAAMKAYECLMNAFPYLIQDTRSADDDEITESAKKIITLLAPALEKGTGDRSRGKVGVIGHSHMDTAWLWPVSETVRKCARTYAQALTLMDMYPEYTFIQSSALHLDWMREYYPAIFEQIKQRVAEGRYEPNGGVWVECDCNVTGGEAMVRQFLYGQRFTKKYLGYLSDSFWLPDTFGYNAAIPQIMQGFGVKYFYTTKMGWNDLNHFPAETFVWRGIDGSEVITHLNRTHFIPDVNNMLSSVRDLTDKHTCDMRLAAYGFGDGGGGPTYAMLEFLKRAKDLDGLPKVENTTISKFMQEVEERRDKLPLYDGELYLELHRGTLTQMHEVKKNNRLAEEALHDLELFNVLSGKAISEKRDEYYKILLKNQFHDILPGTSIPKVYDICVPEMHKLIADAKADTAAYAAAMTTAAEKKISVYNQLSFDRGDIVVLDGEHTFENRVSQTYTDFDGNVKTVVKTYIPAMSSLVLTEGEETPVKSLFTAEDNTLLTPFYKVAFDENGYISSLYDLQAEREVKRDGASSLGTLWIGEDMPRSWDNWDIDDDVFRKMHPVTDLLSREVVSDGAVEYRIRSVYKLGRKSSITVDTVFYAGMRRIDFEVKADWAERHQLLKAGFDVNIRSAFVKSEIQFGHIDRPTTRNNTWEEAKFEICNHKWSDLSETRYGVALLNDSKYGLSCEGSDMRLTLHKGGCRPDPFTDMGMHTMTYSLLPHTGAFDAEKVIYPAYELNYKPIVVEGELSVPKLFTVSAPGIICETVKNAEDIENAYVLRLYEAERNAANCTLTLPGAKAAWITDMMEEKKEELVLDKNGNTVLHFKPFEIKTVLVER